MLFLSSCGNSDDITIIDDAQYIEHSGSQLYDGTMNMELFIFILVIIIQLVILKVTKLKIVKMVLLFFKPKTLISRKDCFVYL